METMILMADTVKPLEKTIPGFVLKCMAPVLPLLPTWRHHISVDMSAVCAALRTLPCSFSCKVPLGIASIRFVDGTMELPAPDALRGAVCTAFTILVS